MARSVTPGVEQSAIDALQVHNAALRQLVAIHDRLAALVLQGADVTAITRMMADLVGRRVLLLDALLQVRTMALPTSAAGGQGSERGDDAGRGEDAARGEGARSRQDAWRGEDGRRSEGGGRGEDGRRSQGGGRGEDGRRSQGRGRGEDGRRGQRGRRGEGGARGEAAGGRGEASGADFVWQPHPGYVRAVLATLARERRPLRVPPMADLGVSASAVLASRFSAIWRSWPRANAPRAAKSSTCRSCSTRRRCTRCR
jgi:hypothetical protein